jgi:hypothetical protein
LKAYLLDANVLIALAWPQHVHPATAHKWFAKEGRRAWATCAGPAGLHTAVGFITGYYGKSAEFPGITATTSPTDYFPLEQSQMFRFDGKSWLPFGPVEGNESTWVCRIQSTRELVLPHSDEN